MINPTYSYATCDFAKDIKENTDGTFTYSRECHIEMGKNVKQVSLLGDRVSLLEKEIELKDLTISKYEERNRLWMDTSFKLNDKIQTYDHVNSTSNMVYFGLGMGLTILSVWAASQINR